MSFAPVVPMTGLPGWQFLQATYDRQMDEFRKAPIIKRDLDYFRAHANTLTDAKDLVSDRRLLKVALGAFGLQDDINNRAFIRAILESDTGDPKSLVNRISDQRYKDMASAFAFAAPFGPKTSSTGFADFIAARFETQAFEVALGNVDQDMRLALSAKRELAELARESGTDNTKWYKAIGRPPLRAFLETALGLPQGFGKIDLDQQLGVLKAKANTHFGVTAFADFAEPDFMDKIVQRFQLLSQINNQAQMSSASIALQLLQ